MPQLLRFISEMFSTREPCLHQTADPCAKTRLQAQGDLRLHVGELFLHQLSSPQAAGRTEYALQRVADVRHASRIRRHPSLPRQCRYRALVEAPEGSGQTFAHFRQQVGSSGTNTSRCSTISPVDRSAQTTSCLRSFGEAESGFIRVSTTKPRMTPSSFAQTTAKIGLSVTVGYPHLGAVEQVATVYRLSRHWLHHAHPDRSHDRVLSVRSNLSSSPVASFWQPYFSRCASLPYAWIGCITSDDCTLIAER